MTKIGDMSVDKMDYQKLADQLLAEEKAKEQAIKSKRREYYQKRKEELQKLKKEMTPEQREWWEALEWAKRKLPKKPPEYWDEKSFIYAKALVKIILKRLEDFMGCKTTGDL